MVTAMGVTTYAMKSASVRLSEQMKDAVHRNIFLTMV